MPDDSKLVDGQRLSRDQLEQLFDADLNLKHAELLDGIVYRRHDGRAFAGSCRSSLIGWMGFYSAYTPHLTRAVRCHVALDDKNELQPDAVLARPREHGGDAQIDPAGIIRSATEFAADVITTINASILPNRIDAHERGGTREYLVWYAEDDCFDWHVRRRGSFVVLASDPADGLLKSEVFPGLWLDAAALIRGDLTTVLAALQQGLASSEHAAFVSQLASRRQ